MNNRGWRIDGVGHACFIDSFELRVAIVFNIEACFAALEAVGVEGDRIVAVGEVQEAGRREIDADGAISYLNPAAEQFFQGGRAALVGRPFAGLLPADSPVRGLIAQARASGHSVSEYGISLETPRIGAHFVSVAVSVMIEPAGSVVVSLQERSIARKIDDQLIHRNAARSVTAMAAMLAHEVKNPLSGIRGAAQLLERNADPGDRELTRLICEEADRIVALVDRM